DRHRAGTAGRRAPRRRLRRRHRRRDRRRRRRPAVRARLLDLGGSLGGVRPRLVRRRGAGRGRPVGRGAGRRDLPRLDVPAGHVLLPGLRALPRLRPVRPGAPRRARRATGVRPLRLVRDALPGRDGGRAAVLGRRRAGDALPGAPAGHGRARHPRGGRGRPAVRVLPLDAAPVGDLRGRRAGRGLRELQPRHGDPAPERRPAPPARRPRRRPPRPGGRRPGRRGHAVRGGGVAGTRHPADHRGPRRGVRPVGRGDAVAGRHRGHRGRLHALSLHTDLEGHQRPQPGQHRAGGGARRVLRRRRTHDAAAEPADAGDRQLPRARGPDEPAVLPVRRAGVAHRLDDLLLGDVDRLGALRRRVHRPHLARPHDPRVRRGRAARAQRVQRRLVLGARRGGPGHRQPHRRRDRRGGRPGRGAGDVPVPARVPGLPGDGAARARPRLDLLRGRRRRRHGGAREHVRRRAGPGQAQQADLGRDHGRAGRGAAARRRARRAAERGDPHRDAVRPADAGDLRRAPPHPRGGPPARGV
ncbi:MAG: Glycine betaine transporter OpuD, partial [uncultured Actinomycetospora sp.]